MTPPLRSQWICFALRDGGSITCRFVTARRGWWEVDHGAYGVMRDDSYVPETIIAGWTEAPRSSLLLSFRDCYGNVRRVGRYATHEEAELAFTGFQAMPIPYVEPEDIANLALFLASDESRYITGQQIRVDIRWGTDM